MSQPLPIAPQSALADTAGNATVTLDFGTLVHPRQTVYIELLTTRCTDPTGQQTDFTATATVFVSGIPVATIQQAALGQVPGLKLVSGAKLSVSFTGMTSGNRATVNAWGTLYDDGEDIPPWIGISPVSGAPTTAMTFLQRNVAAGTTALVPTVAGKTITVYDLLIWPLGLIPYTPGSVTGGNVSIDDQAGNALLFMPAGVNPLDPWHRDCRPGITTVENGTTPLTLLNAHVGAGGPNSDFYAIAAYQ